MLGNMKRLQTLIVATILVLIPLLYTTATIDPLTVPRFVMLSFLLLAAITGLAIEAINRNTSIDLSFMRRSIVKSCFAYLVIASISLISAINLGESVFDLLKAVNAFIFFILITALLTNGWEMRNAIIKAVVVSGLCLGIVGAIQYFGIAFDYMPGRSTPYGTMANKNLLSSALLLIMPFALYCSLRYRGAWRMAGAFSVVVSGYVIFIGHSRAVWLALILGLLVTLATAELTTNWLANSLSLMRFRLHRILRVLSICILSLILVLAVVATFDLSRGADNSLIMQRVDDHSMRLRSDLWRNSLSMSIDNPLTGVGIGNWKIVVPQYGIAVRTWSRGNTYFQRPHNDFIWVLSETGVAGFLFYVGVFAIGAFYCWRLLVRERNKGRRLLWLLMLLGLTEYVIVAALSYPRERIFHTVILMLILAFITAGYHRSQGLLRRVTRFSISSSALAIVLALLLSIVVGFTRLNGEIHTKRAVATAFAENWERTIYEIDIARSPLMSVDPTATPLACYRGIANSKMGKFSAAISDYKEALKANPYHFQTLNNLATCFEQKGDHEKAIQLYERALQVAPSLEEVLVNIAAVYFNMGKYQLAYDYLTRPREGRRDDRYDEFLRIVSESLANR